MIDKIKLLEIIAGYKQHFPSHWELEKFKWETLKICSLHLDIETADFVSMWRKCVSKSGGMLNSRNNFPAKQIISFYQEQAERTRDMFRYLYNEEIDLLQRIKYFREESEKILSEHNENHPETIWKTCYQNTNAISIYLWMRYPDKYYIYKYSECRAVDKLLSGDNPVIRGGFNSDVINGYRLYDEIREELTKDSELIHMFEEAKDDSCYSDSKYITLTLDLGYYIYRYFLKGKQQAESIEKESVKEMKASSEPSEGQNYWWLTGSPKYWSPSEEWELGGDIDYTLYNENGNKRRIFKHFYEAKPNDAVIVYEATPVLKIVAIGRVMSETDGEVLYIKKMEELLAPVPYSEILNNDILKKSEPVQNRCQGSLFHLSQEEYVEVMRLIRENNPEPTIEIKEDEPIQYEPYSDEEFLKDVFMDNDKLQTLKSLLLRKKNLILQGAPGVGKTHVAQRLAFTMIGEKDVSRVKVIQFHQNYSYEDFVMGYKPNEEGGFELRRGVFYDFCAQAKAHKDELYFLVIDEINRGNMSKIFGELLQLIEADYRDKPIQLAYNKQPFSVPENLCIIGMMNTADRSLAMIDYALRRRFCFYKMTPAFTTDSFRKFQKSFNSPLLDKVIEQIKQLNKVIEEDASLGEGFAIGHSYFCKLNEAKNLDQEIKSIVLYDIIPMLEEYWFDDKKTLDTQKGLLLDAIK